MKLIGENIHIISKSVREALENRDENFVKNLIKIQNNVDCIDLNIGPARGKLDKIFDWLKKTRLKGMVEKLENKAMSKSDQIKKYGKWGLFLFVAIPLPGTGAWTGSLIASMLRMKMKDSLPWIFLGVLTAGLVMSLLSFGIIKQII